MAVMDVKRLIPATRMDMYDLVNPRGENLGPGAELHGRSGYSQNRFPHHFLRRDTGISDKWVAVPMDVLKYDVDGRRFILDVSRETVRKSPGPEQKQLAR